MGRCLGLLVREFHIAFRMWGSPSMLISRNMHNLIRCDRPKVLVLWERDIDNALWELNKDKIIQGIERAAAVIRKYRKLRGCVVCSMIVCISSIP